MSSINFDLRKIRAIAFDVDGVLSPSTIPMAESGEPLRMVNVKDGLVKLLKKESLTKGIRVSITDDNRITLDFHVIVAYGVSISAVTENLISNVKYKVEEFSGMTVDKINVYIEGVRVID